MKSLKFSELAASDIRSIVTVHEMGVASYSWTQVDQLPLTSDEELQLRNITSRLLYYQTNLMNEATIWARAIYPLLVLAEQDDIQAWAQVPLRARYPHVELYGVVDGVLGHGITGVIESPYLIVMEAKKSLDIQDPRFQLYGQLLAAAHLNWENNQAPRQEIYGCYTISDSWTFVRATVEEFTGERPTMTLEFSREYVEKIEAATILKILKQIVATHFQTIQEAI
ncbi:MAG: hypothetical protein R3C14_34500 [Caldilineaceae bacterium]